MKTLLLTNGTILDGSGTPPRPGNVLIHGDSIEAVGHFDPPGEAVVVNCRNLIVAPGFLDVHTHSDLQVLEGRREKLRQGVTTEVVGNCGFSPYPVPRDPAPLREFANGILNGGDSWGWASARDYLREAAHSPTANVVSLVGHGSLRVAVAGNTMGPLPERDAETMERLLEDSLSEGAAGLSTGLMYAPGSSAPFEELERLCRVVARRGKIYASHIRDYADRLVEAVEEQIELARRTGCRLQISHLQAVGAKNWHLQQPALKRIEQARAEGIDVAFDCYPYTAGSTVLTLVLPQHALEGGIEKMLARLRNAEQRKRITSEVLSSLAWRWGDIFISAVGSERNQDAVGKSLSALAEERACEPVDAMIDLLLEEQGDVNMLSFNQSEDNLRQTLTHPLSIIISDGFYTKGRPHPRLWGTFPRLLGTYCREKRWLKIEEAVHKITQRPAERFQVEKRGRLAPGYFADITVFDAATVASPATYEAPERLPVGIRYVFRNGQALEGSLPL